MDIVIPKTLSYRVPVFNDAYGVANVKYATEKLSEVIFLHLASMLKTGGKCIFDYNVVKEMDWDRSVLTGKLTVLSFEEDIVHAA